MVHWLLETDTFLEGNPQRMHEIITSLGMPVRWIKYVPFDGTALDQFPPGTCVVVYGSLNLARVVARERPWTPGLWADAHALRCSTYYAHWGEHLLQQDYAMYPLGEVKRCLAALVDRFGDGGAIFIRPNENDKSFSGAVVHIDRFDHWHKQNTACYDLMPDMLTVVARPQTILSEHRFIVADGRVITGSKYKTGGDLRDGEAAAGFDEAARAYAQGVLDTSPWRPHRMFVLDVAETPGGYRVMEIGSVNSCGLYGCELRPVIEHASRIAAEEFDAARATVTR